MFGRKKEEQPMKVLMTAGCKAVAELLKKNPDVLNDRNQLRELIFSTDMPIRDKNVLMIGYDAELYKYMAEQDSIVGYMYYAMRKKIKREFGLSDRCADWCVDMWSKIYAGRVMEIPIEDYMYTEDFRMRMKEKLDNRF